MKLFYTLLVAITLLTACGDGENKNKSGRPKAIENGPVYVGDSVGNGIQYVYKNWVLVSEIPMKNKDAHGLAKEYYDDGKIHHERNFKEGYLHGKLVEYYPTGEKYIEADYTNNKLHGTKYRYKKDGTIVFEVPYNMGQPIPGIKEHDGSGKLIEQPTVVFTKHGNVLEMKMSDNNKSAEFFQLLDGDILRIQTDNGVGKVNIGSAKKGDIKVRATYKTMFNNKAAVDVEY